MRVILKQDVKGVGRKHEIKNVADGYANNLLIPKKLAEFASPEAIKKSEEARMAAQAEDEANQKALEEKIEKLKNATISLNKKANEKGRLFEKVHLEEISSAIKNQTGINIDSELLKIEKPIKEIGEHQILIGDKGRLMLMVENPK